MVGLGQCLAQANGDGRGQHNLHSWLPDRCDSYIAYRLCRLGSLLTIHPLHNPSFQLSPFMSLSIVPHRSEISPVFLSLFHHFPHGTLLLHHFHTFSLLVLSPHIVCSSPYLLY